LQWYAREPEADSHFAECAGFAGANRIFRPAAGLVFGAVRSARPRRLLGPTVGAAVVLTGCALVLWGVALWVSWGGECPQANQLNAGLDKGISVWPPAAECTDPQGATFWHEALPWAPWLIGGLIVAAAAVLLMGLVVAIRDLRRPAPAATPSAVALFEAPLPLGGPAGDSPGRGDLETGERDPPAMAA
jgi:hypothetical protein